MAETNALALFPYAAELFGGTIDLLQLETILATFPPPEKFTEPLAPNPNDEENGTGSKRAKVEDHHEGDEEDEETRPTSQSPPPTMDSHPTLANSKFPLLRRAALHFLASLIRACIPHVYDMGSTGMLIPNAYITRARATLGYVAGTNEDTVARVVAREAREGLRQLSNALMGL